MSQSLQPILFRTAGCLRASAPGWFKQRRPLYRCFLHQGKILRRHQTAIRGQAAVRSQTATALLPYLSLWGNWETLRPRNLSVPRAGQAKRQARSPKGSALSPEAFAAESRPRQTRDRHRRRIGSVRNRLGTWAASAGSSRSKVLGHRRGGQSKRMRSSLWHT